MKIITIDLTIIDREIIYKKENGYNLEYLIMNDLTYQLLKRNCLQKISNDNCLYTGCYGTYRGLDIAICNNLSDGEIEIK